MSYDVSDDLAYNPFAEEDENNHSSESNLTNGYYSSAFFPKLGNSRPTLRRRRSSLTDKAGLRTNEDRRKHIRSRTEIQIVPPNSAGLHPLKSALAGTIGAVFQDTGITRPHLSRIVNEGQLVDAPTVDDDGSLITSPSSVDEEKYVIVHQLNSKDSLAGVSLKYGISMANLRRANQLWTSDSIHRRDVLYIPIDQASRSREYIQEPKLISLTPDAPDETANVFEHTYASSSSPVNGNNPETNPPSPSVPVLRVPSRQLSYFPPSSNKKLDTKSNGHDVTANSLHLHPEAGSRGSPTSNKYSSSPANNSLTSILTALPITASTRDEIITRLSFDSVSSSFSERSRANSDEEDGHELDEVTRHRRDRHGNSIVEEDPDELSMPTPKASQRPQHVRLTAQAVPQVTLSSSLPKNSHVRSTSSTSPPSFYVSQTHETYVRTSQLEPSPAMELPKPRSRTVGRSLGKSLQPNVEIERTISGRASKNDNSKDDNLDSKLQRMKVSNLR